MFCLNLPVLEAQPVLSQVNIPDAGSLWSNTTITDTTLQPGPGGQGQVWNFFSYFIYPSVLSENYVATNGTGNDLLFPGANLKVNSYFGFDDYYYRTASSLQYLGSKNNSIEVILTNVQNTLTVPLQYGDVVTNSAVTGTGLQGYPLTGTITTTADGTGDLILFSGAFTNTLRVVTDMNLIIAEGTGVDTYLHMIKYSWYTSAYRAPVFQVSILNLDGALGFSHQKYITVSTLTTDIQNTEKGNFDFIINPNPVKNKTNLYFNLNHSYDVKLKVMDLTGRLWKEVTNSVNAGSNFIPLDLSTLPKGIYILSADYGKTSRQRRLIVE